MNKIGKFGEDIACLFLKKHGYEIVERNHLRKWGELDIVAKKEDVLYFIEVKTIKSVTHVTPFRPEDNMNKPKIKKFVRIIQTYLQEKRLKDVDWVMALVAIKVDVASKKARVRFIDHLVF